MSGILDRAHCGLVLIDVQERINSVMVDQSHLPRLLALADGFARLGLPVLATEQYPKGLGATVPELATRLGAPPLVKESFSCYRDPGFRAALEARELASLVVTGIESHVCVMQTALDLLKAGYRVHVPHDAVSSRRRDDRRWALERLAHAGAVVSATESVLFELVERCGNDDFRAVSALVKQIPA